jgi:hypothetical protein
MKKGTAQEFDKAVEQNATSNIYLKLWKAKQEIESVKKNAKNPHFKSNYADINAILEAVEPILHKHGLVLIQPIENGKVCSSIIDIDSGQGVHSEMEIPTIQDPQKLGGAVTYFRRYTLQSLLALQAEDDDANTASQAIKAQKPPFAQDRFEIGLAKLDKGELTKEQFLKALNGFELTDIQKGVIALL